MINTFLPNSGRSVNLRFFFQHIHVLLQTLCHNEYTYVRFVDDSLNTYVVLLNSKIPEREGNRGEVKLFKVKRVILHCCMTDIYKFAQ